MREFIPVIIMSIAAITFLLSIGATIKKEIYQSYLLEQCAEKKEFLIQDVVVRCEIVKDLR